MNLSFIGYTYCIKFLPTGQVYYGSRCAKNCNPGEFWKTYFTSSKLIKQLISDHGEDSFIYEIRRTFSTNPKQAQVWERKVLRRINAGLNPAFLNKSNGVAPILSGWKNPFYGKKHSDADRAVMSEKAKERMKNPVNNPMYGKTHSLSTIEHFSESRIGITYEQRYGPERSLEIKKKASDKLTGDKNPMYGVSRPEMNGDLNPMSNPLVQQKHKDSIKNRPTVVCCHCDKVMDLGGYAVHKRALLKKGVVLP